MKYKIIVISLIVVAIGFSFHAYAAGTTTSPNPTNNPSVLASNSSLDDIMIDGVGNVHLAGAVVGSDSSSTIAASVNINSIEIPITITVGGHTVIRGDDESDSIAVGDMLSVIGTLESFTPNITIAAEHIRVLTSGLQEGTTTQTDNPAVSNIVLSPVPDPSSLTFPAASSSESSSSDIIDISPSSSTPTSSDSDLTVSTTSPDVATTSELSTTTPAQSTTTSDSSLTDTESTTTDSTTTENSSSTTPSGN